MNVDKTGSHQVARGIDFLGSPVGNSFIACFADGNDLSILHGNVTSIGFTASAIDEGTGATERITKGREHLKELTKRNAKGIEVEF